MFSKLFKRKAKAPTIAEQIPTLLQGISTARGAAATVWGLPHQLSQEVIRRRFGDSVEASSETFALNGINGHWQFPPPHECVGLRMLGDDEGRLSCGEITTLAPFDGITLTTRYSRFDEEPVWYVSHTEPLNENTVLLLNELKQDQRLRFEAMPDVD